MTSILGVTMNCPDYATVERTATTLVAVRLVAAENLHPEITSIYHRQGAVVSAAEVPQLAIANESFLAEVSANVLRLHRYKVSPQCAQRLNFVTVACGK